MSAETNIGRRHLAFFAYYYPPLGGAGTMRALSFTRYLPESGWDVTVFTPLEGVQGRDPSLPTHEGERVRVVRTSAFQPRALWERWFGARGAAGEGPGAVNELRVGSVGGGLRTLVRRVLYFPDAARGWIRPAAAAAERVHRSRPFDAILSSSPPLSAHAAAVRLADRISVPTVLDFRDLPRGAVDSPDGREARFVRTILSRPGRVVTVSRSCLAWLRDAGSGDRTQLVMNGFEEPTGGEAPVGEGAAPYIAYAGTLYDDRQDLLPLLERLEVVANAGTPVVLEVAGKVHEGARQRLARFERSGLLRYRGFLSLAAMESFLRASAAVLVWAWEGSSPVGRGQVPAKLFDAMASGRPILLVAGSGSDAEEVGSRVGLDVIPHGDTAAMEAAVRCVLDGRPPRGLVPSVEAVRTFHRRTQARALANILDEAAGARR